jgi:U3 small nucleolar RNA-associated protein 14
MGAKRRPAKRGTSSQGKDTGGNRSKKSRQGKRFHGRNSELMANKLAETREDDVFEADEVDADEDLHASRYDDVENYEYELPEDFEDEEIDEDDAFNSEDERLYGHLFESSERYPSGSSSEEETGMSDEEENVREAFNALQSSSDDEDKPWPEEINDDSGMGLSGEFGKKLDEDVTRKDYASESSEEELPEQEESQETGRVRQQVLQTEAFPESVFHVSSTGMLSLKMEN